SDAHVPLGYQPGFGGIGKFRHIGDDDATSAGVNTQVTVSHTIALPFGATLTNHYQRVTQRNWNQNADSTQGIGDAVQALFQDVALRWVVRIGNPNAPLTNFSASARVIGTRQLLSTGNQGDSIPGDNGVTHLRSYPLTATAVWAGERPLTT